MRVLLAVVVAFVLPASWVLAAEIDDLPADVRSYLEPVHPWGRPDEIDTAEPVRLGGLRPVGAVSVGGRVGLDRALIGAVQAPTVSLPGGQGEAGVRAGTAVSLEAQPVGLGITSETVSTGSLSSARLNALVGLAGAGKLTAESWSKTILEQGLTLGDVCAVWAQFRRDYPREGESPSCTRALWHGARDALKLADVDTTTLPTPQLFVLAEMQLYPGETEGAEKCLRQLLGRLDAGERPGPRVTRGLLAYRSGQCYRHRGESEEAIKWVMNCAEWGTPTETNKYGVRGEGMVEAARLLERVGRADEAADLYRKAVASTTGWGKTVASLDLIDRLLKGDHLDEAAALTHHLADGSCGPVAQAHVLISLAQPAPPVTLRNSVDRLLVPNFRHLVACLRLARASR